MTVLETAYGCAELRTGVGLIGWWGTIVTSIFLVYFCHYLLHGFVVDTSILSTFFQFKLDYKIWEVAIILIKLIYYFCASFLIIVGALKKKELFLLPWLIVACLDIMLLSYNILYMGFAGTSNIVFCAYLTLLFIVLYKWLIVYSYYQERENVKSLNYRNYNSWKR